MRILLLAVLVVLAACRIERTPERQAQSNAELAREAINRARGAFATAMIKHDAGGVASLFTPTGVLARPLGADLTSPPEIQRHLDSYFQDTTITWFAMTPERLDLVSGGGAYETGTYEHTVMVALQYERRAQGRYAIRWARGPEAVHRVERMLLVPQTVRVDTLPPAAVTGS